jgi:exosome complex exonuclease DIS3/RRP44
MDKCFYSIVNNCFWSPVESYVRSLAQPDLLDLVVVQSSGDVNMEDVEDHRPLKKKVIYSEVC